MENKRADNCFRNYSCIILFYDEKRPSSFFFLTYKKKQTLLITKFHFIAFIGFKCQWNHRQIKALATKQGSQQIREFRTNPCEVMY